MDASPRFITNSEQTGRLVISQSDAFGPRERDPKKKRKRKASASEEQTGMQKLNK